MEQFLEVPGADDIVIWQTARVTADRMTPGFKTNFIMLFFSEVVLSAFLNAESLSRQATLNSLLGLEKGSSGTFSTHRSKYDSSIAPDFELDVPTEVYVRILIQNIYSVTETSM
ncbi:hypothetical protein MAR_022505, partial [Mya arenaria]